MPFDAPTVGNVERRAETCRLPSAGDWAIANVALDAGRLGPFWVSAGSLAGRGHSWSGQTRQDSYAFATAGDGSAVILVVADGLGSRPVSQLGARHLTISVARGLAATTFAEAENVLVDQIERAQHELVTAWAPAYGVTDTRLLSCTLVVALVPTTLSEGPILVARVGDSTAFTATDAILEPFTSVFPLGDGPVNMVSSSLPTADLRQQMEIRRIDPCGISKLVLCTDGLADDVYESPSVRHWLARRWIRPGTERWVLESLSYVRMGSQDDRTAVVLWLDADMSRKGGRA